eukprot:Opistho-2@43263
MDYHTHDTLEGEPDFLSRKPACQFNFNADELVACCNELLEIEAVVMMPVMPAAALATAAHPRPATTTAPAQCAAAGSPPFGTVPAAQPPVTTIVGSHYQSLPATPTHSATVTIVQSQPSQPPSGLNASTGGAAPANLPSGTDPISTNHSTTSLNVSEQIHDFAWKVVDCVKFRLGNEMAFRMVGDDVYLTTSAYAVLRELLMDILHPAQTHAARSNAVDLMHRRHIYHLKKNKQYVAHRTSRTGKIGRTQAQHSRVRLLNDGSSLPCRFQAFVFDALPSFWEFPAQTTKK